MTLLGRARELEALSRALGAAEIVLVCGPAGVGKSALVREALGPAVRPCALAGVSDARGLDAALGASVGVDASSDVPMRRRLDRALRARREALWLDGVDRVADEVAARLSSWAADAPIVLTAREARALPGETIALRPLDPEAAAELWERSLMRVGGAPEGAAAEIVERLDRLPAAITWMASRAAWVGERALLARLDAGEPASLDAALTGSLDALGDPERAVLERVAQWPSGCPLTVLEGAVLEGAVLEGTVREGMVLELTALDFAMPDPVEAVDGLARRGLVRIEPPRVIGYRAVRGAVRARLAEEGTLVAREREHAERALAIDTPQRAELEAVRRRFTDREPAVALRAAVALAPREAAEGGAAEAHARLESLRSSSSAASSAASSAEAWDAELALADLERQLGRLDAARARVARVRAADALPVRARLAQARLDRLESRLDEALALCAEAVHVARELGDSEREALAIGERGRLLQSLGRPREAILEHTAAIALCYAGGHTRREALERSLHARATHRAGEIEAAIPMHERAITLHESLGDRRLAAAERGHLGFCLHEVGRVDEAEARFRESIEGLAAVGDVALEHIERVLLARLLADLGRPDEARLELALARTLLGDLPLPRLVLTERYVAGLVELAAGDRSAAHEAFDQGLTEGSLFEVGFEALLPAHLAMLDAERASALLARSEAMVQGLESPGPAAALTVLRAGALHEAVPDVPAELARRSSDVRRALALVVGAPALSVADDGREARLPDGTLVDLRRRAAPRRILRALADARRDSPGDSLDRDALIAAGWPGERMLPAAADKRLRTAIWTLRKDGFGELLLTRDDGYLLDPAVPITGRGES